jgi:hypothetical protein
MLKQLLKHVAAGGAWTTESLAQALDTTPELVMAMLEDLTRRGYLKERECGSMGGKERCVGVWEGRGDACNGACASFSLAGHCVASNAGCDTSKRAWTLNSQSTL